MISDVQQLGLDALRVAQSTQLASLKATRDCAAALTPPRSPEPSLVRDMTALMTSFTLQVLEQQVAYATQIARALAAPKTEPMPVTPNVPRIAATIATAPEIGPALVNTAGDARPLSPDSEPTAKPAEIAPIEQEVFSSPSPDDASTAIALDAQQSDVLAKILPAPIAATPPAGPYVPDATVKPLASPAGGSAKQRKVPSVSGDRPSLKRGSAKK